MRTIKTEHNEIILVSVPINSHGYFVCTVTYPDRPACEKLLFRIHGQKDYHSLDIPQNNLTVHNTKRDKQELIRYGIIKESDLETPFFEKMVVLVRMPFSLSKEVKPKTNKQ